MRIHQIDALRGFALFGILVVNIFVFHAPYSHYGPFYFGNFEGTEINALQTMIWLCAGKFMFIYAFLFGYGFWIQYEKTKSSISFSLYWNRRMFLLAMFGILHVLFLSFGDILLPYALLGLTIPFFAKFSNKTLFLLFLLVYLIPVYEFVLRGFFNYSPIFTHSDKSLETYLEINANGSWWEIFKLRMYDYFSFKNEKLIMYIPKEWSLFIIGILAAKSKLATSVSWKKGLAFCVLAMIIVWAMSTYRPQLFTFFDHENSVIQRSILGLMVQFSEFIHGMLYIIGFFLIWKIKLVQQLLASLIYAGKLSLSNYILQSLICVIIFSGFGFYGQLKPTQLIGLAMIIFAGQIVFSYTWLQFNKYGPLEGIWRKFSYRHTNT